jgi:hypothetical protein
MDDSTQVNRPLPPRLSWGWFAWEATLGYIAEEYSPDASLTLQFYPSNDVIMWDASVTWADIRITVTERVSNSVVLADLWGEVEQHYQLFKTLEAAVRRPVGYKDDEWFDSPTLEVFSRLVSINSSVFADDWLVVMVYRPTEKAEMRVQSRLVAMNSQVMRGGQGATVRDCGRNLMHNATPDYKKYKG